MGSVLVGDKTFIQEALRVRKLLGGGMRQTGVVTSMALEALKGWEDRIKLDHLRAKKLFQALKLIDGIKAEKVITNIVKFTVDGVQAIDFCDWLKNKDVFLAPVRGS